MTVTVMPGESEKDLEALQQNIRNEWNPQGDHENFLVDQMISARWRLERLARWEDAAIEKAIEAPGWYTKSEARQWDAQPADRHVLSALGRKNSIFDKLERYTRATERAYSKAIKELQQHRAGLAKAAKQSEATAKQNKATAKQNKAKADMEWLRAGLASIDLRDVPDPMAGLWDRQQNEPNIAPPHPVPTIEPPA